MLYQYLFRSSHNGYYSTYRPFTCCKKLTQEDADKLVHMYNKNIGRQGSSISDLKIPADDHGYDMKVYRCEYKITEECHSLTLENYDELPNDFKGWEIINNISGNY